MPTSDKCTPFRITRARLVDGTGSPPLDDAVVRVGADGTITYAGPAADAPALEPGPAGEAGEDVVDVGGRTVLPGFIDCHVHLAFESARDIAMRYTIDPTVEVFRTADRLRRTLHAGVTTARDLGGLAAGYRAAVADGLTEGPRLHTAIRIMSHTAGHADFSTPEGFDVSRGLGEVADTVDEVRVAVRRLLREGADVIKVCATGGTSSPHDQPEDEGLTEDEIRAVVEEVRRHGGRPVAAHAQGTAGILSALRGGVTSIEHGYGLDDQTMDLAGEQGTFVVPTLSTSDGIDQAKMAPYHYEKKMRWVAITNQNIARAIERGLRIAMGTDSAIGPHGQNLRELGHLVALGMAPSDAIQAGTRVAAELLGLSDRIGTLEAGKLADIVVCEGDPLADIRLLGDPANVVCVVQQGVVRKRTFG
ncbi:metal-dependent hydrolase family protein [Flindersiella endophytica]